MDRRKWKLELNGEINVIEMMENEKDTGIDRDTHMNRYKYE